MNKTCPFCIENNLLKVNVLYEDNLWYITDMMEESINNAAMAITKRHVATPFEINEEEWAALQNITRKMKDLVDSKEQPDGYNIGWNVHPDGGQNVPHAHLHLLARYKDEPLAGKGIRYAFKQEDNTRAANITTSNMNAKLKNRIVKICDEKIQSKGSDVGVSFYAFFSNKNDGPKLLMEAAEWWIMTKKLDHFEKAVKVKKLAEDSL